ncbi:MAG: DedA family protein [Propionibacteriaceae bacterium]
MVVLGVWWNPVSWTNVPLPLIALALFPIAFFRAGSIYVLGRIVTTETSRLRRIHNLMTKPGFQKACCYLHRWGAPVVSLSFLTIGFQTMTHLAAGVTKMPLKRYLPALGLGAALWGILYATVGFVGFTSLAALWRFSPALTLTAISVAVIFLIIWGYNRYRSA